MMTAAVVTSLGQTTVDIACQHYGNHGLVTIPIYRDKAVVVTCFKCKGTILVMPEKTPGRSAEHE